MNFLSGCALLALFTLSAVAPAQAATDLTFSPAADAFVTAGSSTTGSGQPDKNYGGAGALQVSAAGSPKGEIQTLFRFDLALVKSTFDAQYGAGQWQIDHITLRLGTNFGTDGVQPNNPIFNPVKGGLFKIDWQANDSWVEGTGNPGSATTDGVSNNSLATLIDPQQDVNIGSFTYIPTGNTSTNNPPVTYSFQLQSAFVSDIMAGNLVSLRAYAGDSGVSYLFNARSFGTALNLPLLTVSAMAIPEPGAPTLLLLATGVLVIGGRWRATRRGHPHAA